MYTDTESMRTLSRGNAGLTFKSHFSMHNIKNFDSRGFVNFMFGLGYVWKYRAPPAAFQHYREFQKLRADSDTIQTAQAVKAAAQLN